MGSSYDSCSCGGRKRAKNRRCASCAGYGRKRNVMSHGYVRVWAPGHPVANADGYALEHRIVLHAAGVVLPDGAHVHHVNGDKQDNRIENLRVVTPQEHVDEHIPVGAMVTNQYGSFPRHRLTAY